MAWFNKGYYENLLFAFNFTFKQYFSIQKWNNYLHVLVPFNNLKQREGCYYCSESHFILRLIIIHEPGLHKWAPECGDVTSMLFKIQN